MLLLNHSPYTGESLGRVRFKRLVRGPRGRSDSKFATCSAAASGCTSSACSTTGLATEAAGLARWSGSCAQFGRDAAAADGGECSSRVRAGGQATAAARSERTNRGDGSRRRGRDELRLLRAAARPDLPRRLHLRPPFAVRREQRGLLRAAEASTAVQVASYPFFGIAVSALFAALVQRVRTQRGKRRISGAG